MSVVITRLNPFEVREVLQGEYTHYYPLTEEVSIPLKSGRCCKNGLDHLAAAGESLNPFEVREVLQEEENMNQSTPNVSIPLKSGRCCKEESKRSVQDFVSIPLKSGRCCKPVIRLRWCLQQCLNPFEVREVLQGQAKQAQIAEKSQSL